MEREEGRKGVRNEAFSRLGKFGLEDKNFDKKVFRDQKAGRRVRRRVEEKMDSREN